MIARRLSVRIFALFAAYAFVLQALLTSIVLTTHATGSAPLAFAVICTSASDADQPIAPDKAPCVLHCLMAASGDGGLPPPVSAIAVIIVPSEIRISLLRPIETLGRVTTNHPQIPRAPPLA
jgi:hypothetical protein